MRKTNRIAFTFASTLSLSLLVPACGDPDLAGADDGSIDADETGDADAGDDGEDADAGDESGDGDGDGDGESGDEPGTCVEVRISTEPVTPTVLMLVDQSGSMTEDFGGQSRWATVYETLMDPQDGLVGKIQDRVDLGLSLYTSQQGHEGGECPQLTEVAPAPGNYAAIDAVFSTAAPVDDTPTGDALMAVADKLAAMDVEGPRAIVLATDGRPDTCEQPDPQQGETEAVAAAQAAWDLGIRTYVISVGDEVGHEHLQDMANAGAGLDPDGAETFPYFEAVAADQLVDAFAEITDTVENCILPLDGTVDLDDACAGTVTLDGQVLECAVDWQLIDSSTLELLGDACDTLRDGEEHDLTAAWSCGGPAIP
jgi:hypothetical protein